MDEDDPGHSEAVPVEKWLENIGSRLGPPISSPRQLAEFKALCFGTPGRAGALHLRLSQALSQARGDQLWGRYRTFAAGLGDSMGLELPDLTMAVDEALPSGQWAVDVHKELARSGELLRSRWLAGEARKLGWDAAVLQLLLELSGLVRRRLADFLSLQKVHEKLERLRGTDPILVAHSPSLAAVQMVLKGLLAEQVPVRDLRRILECLVQNADTPTLWVELVRTELGASICAGLQIEGQLSVLTLAEAVEEFLLQSLRRTPKGSFLEMDPLKGAQLLEHLGERLPGFGELPWILLASPPCRAVLKRLTERSFPEVTVLSWNEIPAGLKVHSLGEVGFPLGPNLHGI